MICGGLILQLASTWTLLMFSVTAQEDPGIVIARPGQDVELMCDVAAGVGSTLWQINGTLYALTQLFSGAVSTYNISGRNLVIEDIMMNDVRNGSEYQCVLLRDPPDPSIMGNISSLYVAGVSAMVPDVTVVNNTININGNNVTFTLSWGEPFNNFDPIVNYIVSCSGDVTCPADFTTTDTTTRSYTITNLTSLTNYTFSVVATNSIGSGEAGVVMITTPPAIGKTNITSLSCQGEDLINRCVVTWELSSQGSVTGYQICYYLKSTEMVVMCVNVNSSPLEYTFDAPTLSMFSDTVVVTVTIFNQLGKGPTSDPRTAKIYVASSVITAIPMLICSPVASQLYNITVTCTIHPDSRADQCVVMAMADDGVTRTGIAPITDRIAIVIINDLQCGVMYNITTEGALNGTLVGPGLPHGNFAAGPCPVIADSNSLSTGAAVAIGCVITLLVSVTVTAIVTTVIMYLLMKRKNESTPQDNINKVLYEEVTSPSHTSKNDVELQQNPAYGARSKVVMDTNPAYESYK